MKKATGLDSGFGAEQFNSHQSVALQGYGKTQSAVDYILAQRYHGINTAPAGASPPEKEGFGMVARPSDQYPSLLELRYRGL